MTDFANLGIKVTSKPVKTAEKDLDNLGKQAGVTEKRVNKSTRSMSTGFNRLGVAIAGGLAALGIGRATRGIIEVGARFEDVRSILEQVTGSTQRATEEFDKLMTLGRNSSVETLKIAELQASLLATQISLTTNEWLTFIEAAENTLFPDQTLTNLAVFVQRLDQGMVSLRDLDRVADRGLPVYRILQEELGLTRYELDQLNTSAGGAAQVLPALQRGLERSFSGSAEARANNMSRLLNNFGDAVQRGADIFNTGFAPAIKEAISDVTTFLDDHPEQVRALGNLTGSALQGVVNAAQALAGASTALGYAATPLAILFGGGLAFGVTRAAVGAWTTMFSTAAKSAQGISRTAKALTSMAGSVVAFGRGGAVAATFLEGLEMARVGGRLADAQTVQRLNALEMHKSLRRLGITSRGEYARSMTEAAAKTYGLSSAAGFAAGKIGLLGAGLGVAAAGAAALVAAKVGDDMKDINDHLGGVNGESVTFGQTWRANARIIREDMVEAFDSLDNSVRRMASNIPTGFVNWLRSFSNPNAMTGPQGAAGTDRAGNLAAAGFGVWDPSVDPLNAPHPSRWARMARLQEAVFDDLASDIEFWRNQTLSNAGGVRAGGSEPQLAFGRPSAALPAHRGANRHDLVRAGRLADAATTADRIQQMMDDSEALIAQAVEERDQRIRDREEFYDFSGSVRSEWNRMLRGVTTGTNSISESVRDMVKNLSNELEQRVLDHAIGAPFRKLMDTIFESIFESISNRAFGGRNGNIFNAIFGNTPSAAGGGYTGRMSGPGVDGRGGRPWIVHDDEYITPGRMFRGAAAGGTPFVINLNGIPLGGGEASAGGDATFDFQQAIIDDFAVNGPVSQSMQANFDLRRSVA